MSWDQEHIDIEVLRRYYNNELSAAERNNLEKQALDDPFLKEAMDGFDENPDSFNTFYNRHKSKLTASGRNYTFIIAVTVLIALFGITSLLKLNDTNKKDDIAENIAPNIPQAKLDTPEPSNEVEVIPTAIETLTFIPKAEQITVEEVVEHQEQVKQETTAAAEEIHVDEPIENDHDFPIADETMHKLGQEVLPTVYLHDLLVVDYRQLDRINQKVSYLRYELSGLSADRESDSSENELVETEAQIPYIEYLDKSMLYFAKGKLKKALSRYLIILEQYPQDLNASFYGGLSYFNVGEYEKAVDLFDQILASNTATFYEEAMWYKVKSLVKIGLRQEAKQLLEKIIAQGGFYSKEAIELKSKL